LHCSKAQSYPLCGENAVDTGGQKDQQNKEDADEQSRSPDHPGNRRAGAGRYGRAGRRKSFDRSAVLGPIHQATKTGHFTKGAISLAVNGTVKQNSDLRNMIWSVAEQIAKLSEAFELKPGDIIYSGTPENVGPVVKGDVLLCKLDGLPDMSIRIT